LIDPHFATIETEDRLFILVWLVPNPVTHDHLLFGFGLLQHELTIATTKNDNFAGACIEGG
jgi:hypothetical protein